MPEKKLVEHVPKRDRCLRKKLEKGNSFLKDVRVRPTERPNDRELVGGEVTKGNQTNGSQFE